MRRPADMRRRFRSLMEESHYTYPRNTMRSHRVSWYLDGHLASRPVNGLYAYANFAEYLMYLARFGKRGQQAAFVAASRFYALTRRAMQNALSTYPVDSRLPPKARKSLSLKVEELCAAANEAHEAVVLATGSCECPACKGAHSLSVADAELLEGILREQSANGTITPSSGLYIAPGDEPQRTVR